MTGPSFGARLRAALADRGPLCAGIDPHPALLESWGLPVSAGGLQRFALTAAEALAPVAAAIKPQSAFFERFGSAGIAVLEETMEICRQGGAQVILDVKRGDIGSTALGYAEAYLDPAAPLHADAITASPYLGFGSLNPMIEVARAHHAGIFVLALTSNPEGPQVQHARVGDGRQVATVMLEELRRVNAENAEHSGSFGAVVGATIDGAEASLAIDGPLLVPGIGAQGGTVADVRRIFDGVLPWVVPSSSREILGAGPDIAALRAATLRSIDQFAELQR